MANIRKISRTIDVCIHEDVISQYQSGRRSDKVQIENYLVERLSDAMKTAMKEIEIELLATLQGFGDVYHEPADVAPVIHAHWITINNPNYSPFDGSPEKIVLCSRCGNGHGCNSDFYCCVCGAKMDEEEGTE